MKKAFTLLELIVVIGIIAVLAGVLLASFRTSTESARAAQCLTNMKNLAQAVNAAAMEDAFNHNPPAGSTEIRFMTTSGASIFVHNPGWISWLCNHHEYSKYRDRAPHWYANEHKSVNMAQSYSDNDEDTRFAITNGAIWRAVAGNRSIYTCPTHVRYCREHQHALPNWSYVMNSRFGWDSTKSAKIGSFGIEYGRLKRADRTLMFAELPAADPDSGKPIFDDSETGSDSVLQFQAAKAKSEDKFTAGGNAKAETIGFVHKTNRGKWCAHVVFADCHTEKLVWGKDGIKAQELASYLCRGFDVVFDGSGWSLPTGGDAVGN